MAEFNDRYGIAGSDINSLNRRWNRIKYDSAWGNFDEFLLWCAQNDWEKGLCLVKKRKSLPHGPENSFLVPIGEYMKSIKVPTPVKALPEPEFCDGCTRKCHGNGCADYKNWFVEQWNTKIHRDIPKPVVADFRYEHPDLVREGIVWRG